MPDVHQGHNDLADVFTPGPAGLSQTSDHFNTCLAVSV